MKVLFIGGTGNISRSCTAFALDKNLEITHFNRGNSPDLFAQRVETIRGDVKDRASMKKLLDRRRFDVVVNWIAYTPSDIDADVELFRGRVGQYIFISSASVYHKPPSHYVITEGTPAYNPFWKYSQNKIACEERLRDLYRSEHFPMTIVRPSHTYSDGWMPTLYGSRDFTVVQRMLDGRPIVVHGDGESLWTLTHSDDFAVGFVGLLGNPRTIGETFQITSDEVLTWNQIHETIASAFGATPRIVHIPTDFINEHFPERGAGIIGDKAYSVVFDNSKIRRFVPEFHPVITFHEGMLRSARYYAQHPEAKVNLPEIDKEIDALLALWNR